SGSTPPRSAEGPKAPQPRRRGGPAPPRRGSLRPGGGSYRSRRGPSPHSYFQSGSSGCFRSQRGRRLWTVGIVSKLYAGGGEVVAHSSVQASHGLSPAGLPFRSDTITL